MQIQHQLGADVIFAFDELTTLMNTRGYQEQSVERTHAWAIRCLAEHRRLTDARPERPYQALFGVVQGAQYEDLRRRAARDLAALDVDGHRFDGFGIGGALEKQNLGTITGWVSAELPEDKPRHMLGISEPDDLFTCVENGADTFDCVSPSRVARNAAVYTRDGRFNVNTAPSRRSFEPDRRRVRLLHLRALHAGLPAPSVQGQGDAGRDPVHHPQRAVRDLVGGSDQGQHLRRLVRRPEGRDAPAVLPGSLMRPVGPGRVITGADRRLVTVEMTTVSEATSQLVTMSRHCSHSRRPPE